MPVILKNQSLTLNSFGIEGKNRLSSVMVRLKMGREEEGHL